MSYTVDYNPWNFAVKGSMVTANILRQYHRPQAGYRWQT
jgi:hypothetical protein